jgi:hypothetical protein
VIAFTVELGEAAATGTNATAKLVWGSHGYFQMSMEAITSQTNAYHPLLVGQSDSFDYLSLLSQERVSEHERNHDS